MTSPSELIDRAHALVPGLRARAEEAEQLGHLHDETVREFVDAELLKVLTPKRFGGFQYNWDTAARIVEAIAAGDGSAGWVVNAYICTNWVVSTFPLEAQEEVFAGRGFTIGPCPMNPMMGKARKVDGGYRVTLKAPFGSGAFHGEWAVLCAMLAPDGLGFPTPVIMLVPRSDFRFDLKTWSILGMRGTGSATLAADDIFVPHHRLINIMALTTGKNPGAQAHDAGVYRVPVGTGFQFCVAAALIGMARHGVEALREHLLTSKASITGQARKSQIAAQMRLGTAAAPANAASALNFADCADTIAATDAGTFTVAGRARVRLNSAYAAQMCRQSIGVVKDTAGANALRTSSVIQRIFRDIHTASGNFAFNVEQGEEIYGRQQLGFGVENMV